MCSFGEHGQGGGGLRIESRRIRVNFLVGQAYYAVLPSARTFSTLAQMDGKSRGMYSPGETDSIPNAPAAVAHAAQGPTPSPGPAKHGSPHIYDLRRGNLCADS